VGRARAGAPRQRVHDERPEVRHRPLSPERERHVVHRAGRQHDLARPLELPARVLARHPAVGPVIFPVSENESRGIEDARFVRFTHPDGRICYYATYTAYNGFRVLPQLIETADFRHFKINTLNGRCVQNKGWRSSLARSATTS